MIDWPSLLRDYLLSLQTRGHTVGTLESAARALKVWRAWYQAEGLLSPGDVTRADLDRFHEALRTTPGARGARLGPSSIDRIMQVVRDLLRWAVKREHLLLDPTAELLLPAVRAPLPRTLTVEEMTRLLEAADDGTLLGVRDLAVLETFYGTGVRKLELMRLDVADLDLCERKLRVMGKGRRERFVPVGEALAERLTVYLRDCRPQLAGRTDVAALFLTRDGERYSGSGMAALLARVGRRAGIPLAAHRLRHAFAVHLLQCGADMTEIQHLLGHRSLSSTQIYTHISNQVFGRKFRNCHPRGGRLTRGDA